MATIDLHQRKLPPEESKAAFQKFLDGLEIRRPRQLVLVQPQLVPEELFDLETARRGGYFIYPPVGLLYIAAVAKEIDPQLDVQIIDLNYELLRHSQSNDFDYGIWQELLFNAIKKCDAPHVGVTFMFGTTKPTFVAVSAFIRQQFPGVPILSGGVQATYDYQEVLEAGSCDIVFRNEGELQYKAFLERCIDPRSEAVPWGSAVRTKGGVHELGNADGDVPMDWDIRELYSMLDIKNYHLYGSLGPYSRYTGADKPFATVLSNRGCRARCTFCGVRFFNGKSVRQREVSNVISEMKFLRDSYQVRHFDWLDDDLLYDRENSLALFRRISEELPEVTWAANNGLIATSLDSEMLLAIENSNCLGFKIGLESGNREILKSIRKPANLRKFMEFALLVQDHPKMFISVNMILGLPNETLGQMMDSFMVSVRAKLDWTNYYIYQPLKNTESYNAFGGLSDQSVKLSHGKDNIGPVAEDDDTLKANFNPVRGKIFHPDEDRPVRSGYEIFEYDPGHLPSRKELAEIWFTFNIITNFLLMPDKVLRQSLRLENTIKFISSLSDAYPNDPSMISLLVFLMTRSGNYPAQDIKNLRGKADHILNSSDYWSSRNDQFNFTDFLSGNIPEIPGDIKDLITNYPLNL